MMSWFFFWIYSINREICFEKVGVGFIIRVVRIVVRNVWGRIFRFIVEGYDSFL